MVVALGATVAVGGDTSVGAAVRVGIAVSVGSTTETAGAIATSVTEVLVVPAAGALQATSKKNRGIKRSMVNLSP